MLNVSIMASLRNLPLVSEYGLSALCYFMIVGICFLIPYALVSAELATGWPKDGGVYVWVREGLGERWGFLAIWMQWVHNVTWFPVILSFVATTFAYFAFPHLVNKHLYVLFVILGCFWGMTFLNFLGIKTSSWFSTVGVILGTIIPGLFIISLGCSWLISGHPSQVALRWESFVPDLHSFGNIVFLAGLFLAFAGLEVSSGYAASVKNPQKNYPRAILIAALITFLLFMLGALSIAVVIPKSEISLVAGVMEAFKAFFAFYHLEWILPLMGILLIIGAIAETNSWIIGPVKGLQATAIHGNLPPLLQKENKREIPIGLLFLQGIIVTAASLVFLTMPTVSGGFWMLSALSAQMYLVMYILLFLAALRLRYTKPHVPRPYRVSIHNRGVWLASSLGILSSLFAIFISFFPPSQIQVSNKTFYVSFLITSLIIMCLIPLCIYQFKKPSWMILEKNSK